MHEETKAALTAQVRILGPYVYNALSYALGQSRKRCVGLPGQKYPHLLPMAVRCDMREFLEEVELPDGWTIEGNPCLMAQLFLKNADERAGLRFLKERRKTYPGGVPPAGRSAKRRNDWSVQDQPIPHMGIAELEPAWTNLLLLWDLQDAPAEEEAGFTLRVVHTIAPGEYGRTVPLDFSLDVLPGGTIFDNLEFRGDDEEVNLFQAELDEAVDENDE